MRRGFYNKQSTGKRLTELTGPSRMRGDSVLRDFLQNFIQTLEPVLSPEVNIDDLIRHDVRLLFVDRPRAIQHGVIHGLHRRTHAHLEHHAHSIDAIIAGLKDVTRGFVWIR
jgi:hypothetical protein